MLVIRMQRTGRKGHAMFRLVVQDSRLTPTSGKIVARLGSYDPHVKTIVIDKEKAAFYLEHGAQPSERVTRLLKKEGVKLPAWVKLPDDKNRTVRNADKRRSTRPAVVEDKPVEDVVPAEAEAEAETIEEASAEHDETTQPVATVETAEAEESSEKSSEEAVEKAVSDTDTA